jgi:hypothetical protein
MCWKYLRVVLLLPISISVTFAQGVRPTVVREFPAYKVYPGALDGDGFPINGSRLCTIEKPVHCFWLAPQIARFEKGDVQSDFALRTTSKRIKLDGGGSLVLFNANCGGGSGSADRYVLLRSEPDGHIKNLLPEIIVTNQADVAAWNLPTVSPMPVLLTADYIDGGGLECHYCNHFFEVRMYLYDPLADRYKLRHSYQTAHKYPGIDN